MKSPLTRQIEALNNRKVEIQKKLNEMARAFYDVGGFCHPSSAIRGYAEKEEEIEKIDKEIVRINDKVFIDSLPNTGEALVGFSWTILDLIVKLRWNPWHGSSTAADRQLIYRIKLDNGTSVPPILRMKYIKQVQSYGGSYSQYRYSYTRYGKKIKRLAHKYHVHSDAYFSKNCL